MLRQPLVWVSIYCDCCRTTSFLYNQCAPIASKWPPPKAFRAETLKASKNGNAPLTVKPLETGRLCNQDTTRKQLLQNKADGYIASNIVQHTTHAVNDRSNEREWAKLGTSKPVCVLIPNSLTLVAIVLSFVLHDTLYYTEHVKNVGILHVRCQVRTNSKCV